MAGVTLADVYRVYVKPSMKGRLVIRKKTVIRRSERVKEVNKAFAQAKIAARAHEMCAAKYPQYAKRCPWPLFVRFLREAAREAGLTGRHYGGASTAASEFAPF